MSIDLDQLIPKYGLSDPLSLEWSQYLSKSRKRPLVERCKGLELGGTGEGDVDAVAQERGGSRSEAA